MLLTVTELAALCNLNRKTVTSYLEKVKFKTKDSSKLYNIEEAIPVLFQKTRDSANSSDPLSIQLKQSELKHEKLRIERLELELQITKGEFVSIAEVCGAVEKEYTYVRRKLLSIPSKRAREFALETEPHMVQKMLAEDIDEALSHLQEDIKYNETKEN